MIKMASYGASTLRKCGFCSVIVIWGRCCYQTLSRLTNLILRPSSQNVWGRPRKGYFYLCWCGIGLNILKYRTFGTEIFWFWWGQNFGFYGSLLCCQLTFLPALAGMRFIKWLDWHQQNRGIVSTLPIVNPVSVPASESRFTESVASIPQTNESLNERDNKIHQIVGWASEQGNNFEEHFQQPLF